MFIRWHYSIVKEEANQNVLRDEWINKTGIYIQWKNYSSLKKEGNPVIIQDMDELCSNVLLDISGEELNAGTQTIFAKTTVHSS